MAKFMEGSRQLWEFAMPHRGVLSASLALGVLASATQLAQPLAVGFVISEVSGGGSLRVPVALLVSLFLADAVLSCMQSYLLGKTGEGIVFGLRRTLIGRLLRLPIPAHDGFRTGDLLSRVNTDTTLLRTALTSSFTNSVAGALTFIGAIFLMAYLDPLMLGVSLACVAFAAVVVILVSTKVREVSEKAQKSLGRLGSALDRALGAIRTVKLSNAEEREERAITSEARSAYEAGVEAAKLRAVVEPVSSIAVNGSFVLVLGIGGARLASGDMAVEELVAFLLYLTYLVMPLMMIFMSLTDFQQGLAAVSRINGILEVEPENYGAEPTTRPPRDRSRDLASGSRFGDDPANRLHEHPPLERECVNGQSGLASPDSPSPNPASSDPASPDPASPDPASSDPASSDPSPVSASPGSTSPDSTSSVSGSSVSGSPVPASPDSTLPDSFEAPVVRFSDVGFGYSPEREVLEGVSFEVCEKAMVALVGPSGAGKSTVFSLIERLYDADSGSVEFLGRDVRDVPLRELRGSIGHVEQDSPVMAGTIRSNLVYANPDASEAELSDVLGTANLRSFVESLSDGLETEVGDDGGLLSGGERQRMAIARALLKKPRLLLLDEATSNLDANNERELKEAISRASEECTVMVIAHRLSTVVDADDILVLEGGRISGSGTHETLVAENPLYRELAASQFVSARG